MFAGVWHLMFYLHGDLEPDNLPDQQVYMFMYVYVYLDAVTDQISSSSCVTNPISKYMC